MVKVITAIKRKAGMPVEEFQQYWRTRHPEVVTRLPGVRRYIQSHVLPAGYRKGEPVYDGIAEVWADDTDALRAMTRSPAHAGVQADEARFIDRESMRVVITEERVITDGAVPAEAVKSVAFLTRKPGLTVEAFQEYWRGTHGPIAAALPGLRRYVQSHTRRSGYDAGRVPPFDGVVLMWFDSAEAIRDALGTPEMARVQGDSENFLAPGPPPSILTRGHIIIG